MKENLKYFGRIFLGIFITTTIFCIPFIEVTINGINARMGGTFSFFLAIFTVLGVLFSLPLLVYLERKKLRLLGHYLIAGFVGGSLVLPGFSLFAYAKEGINLNHILSKLSENPEALLIFISSLMGAAVILGPFGALYAAIFWRISIKGLAE